MFSMKVMQKLDTELIDQTIAIWQPRSRRELSQEDARQIIENIVGFIDIFNEWETAGDCDVIREVHHAS